MIRAAIVGLGWWGKTLVESAESDVIGFVAGTTRTVTPDVQAFAKANNFKLAPELRGAAGRPRHRRRGAGDAAFDARAQVIAAAAAGKHVFCEKPFTLTKQQAEDAVAAVARPASRSASATTAASIRR